MTGMGSDGVNGIKAIKCAGGLTIAQDEATSVVFGMNKLAIEKGYIDKVLALDKIVQELIEAAR
jgi:two-component system chemotaxis response regulator CheB